MRKNKVNCKYSKYEIKHVNKQLLLWSGSGFIK